jgi:hypothetical protein
MLYHQIPNESESETSRNSSQVKWPESGRDTVICEVYNWHNKLSEGHREVLNLLHAHIQPTDVRDVKMCCIEELILGNS